MASPEPDERLETVDLPAGRPVRPPPAERREAGRALRQVVPRSSHAAFERPRDRPDPLSVLAAQHRTRLPELVPIRWGRMLHSPFTFYRGAAAVMASDLAGTPVTGLDVQLCGDAHLLNFGLYATPERRLVFGANDFDETLRGPWEWDIKRLAASLAVAAGSDGMTDDQARAAAVAAARSYRLRLDEYAAQRSLAVWYATVDAAMVEALFAGQRQRRRAAKDSVRHTTRHAVLHDSVHAMLELCDRVGGRYVIRHHPPLVRRIDDHPEVVAQLHDVVVAYLDTLPEERKFLVRRFTLSDLAMKVVGVGSVGTRCFVGLFHGDGASEGDDPLFLQIKEARPSVLEPYLRPSPYPNHGQRVVVGQRMMQAHPDIFLGWTHAPLTATAFGHAAGLDFYIRQLRDMKGTFDVDRMTPGELASYGELCGWALARSHARSGDAVAISGYLGRSDAFDRALGEFALAYARRNRHDHDLLVDAVADGRVHAEDALAVNLGSPSPSPL